jgi:hypothetical protein
VKTVSSNPRSPLETRGHRCITKAQKQDSTSLLCVIVHCPINSTTHTPSSAVDRTPKFTHLCPHAQGRGTRAAKARYIQISTSVHGWRNLQQPSCDRLAEDLLLHLAHHNLTIPQHGSPLYGSTARSNFLCNKTSTSPGSTSFDHIGDQGLANCNSGGALEERAERPAPAQARLWGAL